MQLPSNLKDDHALRVALEQIVRQISNLTGTLTLTINATSTVVINGKCTPNSVVVLSPMTANAALAVASTYVVPGTGSFTITHANTTAADRKFGYAINGV